MDHPCYKCGHSIEDGKAFCSECGAPQIRVTISEPLAVGASAGDGNVPALPGEVAQGVLGIPGVSVPTNWSRSLRPCTLAAAVAVGFTAVGLYPLLAALGAGFLAVAFTRRRSPGTLIPSGGGARLGALGGLLFFGILTTLDMLAVVVLHKGAEIQGEQLAKLQQWATRYPGAEVQPFLDFVKSPNGFTIMLVASLIVGLVVFVALGSCGGAIAATLWGRRDRR